MDVIRLPNQPSDDLFSSPAWYGDRALVILPAYAGQEAARLGQAALEELRRRGFVVTAVTAASVQEIRSIVKSRRGQVDVVIVAGGSRVVSAAASELSQTKLPLGILPLSPADEALVRSLSLPRNVEEACEVITQGHRSMVDLGWVNGRYFLSDANIGLGVELAERLSPSHQHREHGLRYGLGLIDIWRSARPFKVEIECDGMRETLHSLHITVSNGRMQGGLLSVPEDAPPDDHFFNVYSLPPVDGQLALLSLLPKLHRGTQLAHDQVDWLRGGRITIHTERPMRVLVDGEIVTQTPATFRLIHQALPILKPQA